MKQPKIFVIAEAGVNHNGSEDTALELIKVAAESGADAVKFQTFNADKLVIKGAKKADYQKKFTGDGDQHSLLKSLEISAATHYKLINFCSQIGIEFMSTPFDNESASFLVNLGIKKIKIPSGELTNHPFIAYVARFNLPIILSTGMAYLDEIQEAIEVIVFERKKMGFMQPLSEILTILHCTSNYPTLIEDVNLSAINTLANTFKVPIGYSDHTKGIIISVAAVAAGAKVIEKHFTLDKKMSGPDHAASIEPLELKELVDRVREIEIAMGDGLKAPSHNELPIKDIVRRSVTTVRDIDEGMIITSNDIALLRPGNGIPPKDFEKVIGRKPSHSIPAGTTLHWTDLL